MSTYFVKETTCQCIHLLFYFSTDTEQPQTPRETSTRSLETVRVSTESSSSSSSDWRRLLSNVSREDLDLPQDSPDSTLRVGDMPSEPSQTDVLADGSSTTISRAGERTLLSVTSSSENSTSSALMDSSSRQPPSAWSVSSTGRMEVEDYTRRAPVNTSDLHTSDLHTTQTVGGRVPDVSAGTQNSFGPLNATERQHISTSEGTPGSTPSLRGPGPSAEPSDVSIPAVIPPVDEPTNTSGTDQGSEPRAGPSTESSTRTLIASTHHQEGTEGFVSNTSGQSDAFTLTPAPPIVSSSTAGQSTSPTGTSVVSTEILLTSTADSVTKR